MKADEQLNVDLVEGGIVQSLRENFHNAPRGLDWRIAQLRAAETMVLENKGKIFAALFSDLKKSASESTVCEVNDVLVQIRYLIHNLHRLAKPKNMPWSGILDLSGYKWSQRKEPRGVVLVLGAWNYPFSLCINPLLGAIAAGNAVLLKPSEHARATSRLLSNLISAYLDKQMVLVLEGGITVASRLVEEDFDFICYTGGRVGALEVASACAKRLRPVMLELGGKSPCYIHSSADIVAAAKAIVYSKSLNAGQTCIAPDYCLVDGAIFDDLVGELKRVMRSWFGEGPDQMRSPHLGRIVNLAHFHRLAKLLDVHANDIIYDGFTSKDDLFISLTLILSPDMSSEIMKEEIFGPILPVVKVKNLEEALRRIKSLPSPLAAYAFIRQAKAREAFMSQVTAGGMCINDIMAQYLHDECPFGGIGDSGMGAYRGKCSFNTFSHTKTVCVLSSSWAQPLVGYLRNPPYSELKASFLCWCIGFRFSQIPFWPSSKCWLAFIFFVAAFLLFCVEEITLKLPW